MLHDELLAELREMRARLDQLAAAIVSDKEFYELRPVYACGHRHKSRKEAVECKSGEPLRAVPV